MLFWGDKMDMPHEEYCLAFCPRLCPYKEFWKESAGMFSEKESMRYAGEKHLKWFLRLAPDRCIEDKTVDDAYWVWQELYETDEPTKLSAEEVRTEIQKWIDTTSRIAICVYFVDGKLTRVDYNPSRDPISERQDLYTKVVGVVVTDDNVQIYFQRMCPLWLLMKFGSNIMLQDVSSKEKIDTWFSGFKQAFTLEPWFPKETDRIAERLEGMILHLRWTPQEFGETQLIRCKDYFAGYPSFTEAEDFHLEFLNFMAKKYPSWRHTL